MNLNISYFVLICIFIPIFGSSSKMSMCVTWKHLAFGFQGSSSSLLCLFKSFKISIDAFSEQVSGISEGNTYFYCVEPLGDGRSKTSFSWKLQVK